MTNQQPQVSCPKASNGLLQTGRPPSHCPGADSTAFARPPIPKSSEHDYLPVRIVQSRHIFPYHRVAFNRNEPLHAACFGPSLRDNCTPSRDRSFSAYYFVIPDRSRFSTSRASSTSLPATPSTAPRGFATTRHSQACTERKQPVAGRLRWSTVRSREHPQLSLPHDLVT